MVELSRQAGRDRLGALGLLVVVLAVACAPAPAPRSSGVERHPEAAFLPDPLRGYPRSVGASEAESLRRGHQQLVSGRGTTGVVESAEALLTVNPELEPAIVLRSQAAFVDGDYAAAYEDAEPVAERHVDYVAAQLLVGRAAEKLDRIAEAFVAYQRIAPRSGLADRKAEALRGRAIEITANRAEDLLSRERLEDAEAEIEKLAAWAPNDVRALEATAAFAAKAGDSARELDAVRRLLELEPSTELLRRRASLELEAGEAGEALRILEELQAQNPDDPELARELERAKFRWRLKLLPSEVLVLLDRPELTRAEHAKLLYWLFPDVRYGRSEEGRIASDILDHPHRQEIARVANLGIMRVDSTLHLFYPERVLSRRDALESVLRILSGRRIRPACLGDSDPRARFSAPTLCRLSARCGLLTEPGDCLPEAPASGRFVEVIGFGALEISDAE